MNKQNSILRTHRRSVEHLVAQRATLGSITPPGVLNQIETTRREISRIKSYLQTVGYPVHDLPGIDFDVSDTITLNIDRGLYQRIREIVAHYGIELPDA